MASSIITLFRLRIGVRPKFQSKVEDNPKGNCPRKTNLKKNTHLDQTYLPLCIKKSKRDKLDSKLIKNIHVNNDSFYCMKKTH